MITEYKDFDTRFFEIPVNRLKVKDVETIVLSIEELIKEIKDYATESDLKVLDDRVYTVFNILRNIIHDSEMKLEGLTKKEKKEYYRQKNNYEWAKAYYNLFSKTRDFVLCRNCMRLIETALNIRISMKAASGYKKNYRKISKNKYCSWSMDLKHKDKKEELLGGMERLDRKGYTIRMLTLAPKNIKKLEIGDLENLQKVLKEFWRYKETVGKQTIFDMQRKILGYWGVPEIKYNERSGYNIHYHFMVLGAKRTGYIDKNQLTKAWERTCTKFGNDKIKGSFMKNIGAKHLKVKDKYAKEAYQKGVHYITKYISKGLEIITSTEEEELKAREVVIHCMKGRDMIKRGGLLKANKSNELIFRNIVEKLVIGSRGWLEENKLSIPIYSNGVETLSIETKYFKTLLTQVRSDYKVDLFFKQHFDNKYNNSFLLHKKNKEFEYVTETISSKLCERQTLKAFKKMRKKKYKLCPVTKMRMRVDETEPITTESYETDLKDQNERLRIINNCLEYVTKDKQQTFVTKAMSRLDNKEFKLSDLVKFDLEYERVIRGVGNLVTIVN